MITDETVARINELARKSRTAAGLTAEEQAEQTKLRREYVEAVKASLQGELENTVIQYPDGTKKSLRRQ